MAKINRRDFLRRYAATALAGAGAYSTLSGLNLMNAMAQDGGDYRALVCVFLFGGNDSFNMFVPTDRNPYEAYRDARRNLAVSRESLLPVNPLIRRACTTVFIRRCLKREICSIRENSLS